MASIFYWFFSLFRFGYIAVVVWNYGDRRPQVPDQFNCLDILFFFFLFCFFFFFRCVFSLDDDDDESSPFFSSSLCGLRSSNHRDGHSSTGPIVILMLICTNLFREESFSPLCFKTKLRETKPPTPKKKKKLAVLISILPN